LVSEGEVFDAGTAVSIQFNETEFEPRPTKDKQECDEAQQYPRI